MSSASDAPAAKRPWHLGETVNFHPTREQLDVHAGVETYVLRGFPPAVPFITEQTRITAFGSCFAQHISNHLNKRSFVVLNKQERRSYVIHFNNEMVHTFAIKQQFDWVLRDRQFSQTLWHDRSGGQIVYDETVKRQTRELFDQTDVFIFTLGLAEIWCDSQTDEVFWRTVPESEYDPERHRFRLSTVQENVENLKAIYETVMEFRPHAKIVLTLSPIPLNATFRDIGCVSANTVSKAIMRIAIDQLMQTYGDRGNLFYYPSYEIVRDVFRDPFHEDGRHVKEPIIHYIMCCFERHFCASEEPMPEDFLGIAFSAAQSADRDRGDFSDQTMDLAAAADNVALIESRINHAFGKNDMDGALRVARRAVQINRSSAQLQYLLGLILNNQQKHADACACFAEAVRLAPKLARFRRELGMTLMRLGRPLDALPHFEQAVCGGEVDFSALHHYAGCLFTAGELALAEDVQRRAVARSPEHAGALRQLDAIVEARASRNAAGSEPAP